MDLQRPLSLKFPQVIDAMHIVSSFKSYFDYVILLLFMGHEYCTFRIHTTT